MKEIVPVFKDETGGQFCDGTALHEWLGVDTRFNDWITRRIEEYGFEEGEDYRLTVLSNQKTGRGGDRRSVEYQLTLNMAKELGMIENSSKGQKIRRYFINLEATVKKRLLEEAEMRRLADITRMSGRIKALERTAPDYPTEQGFRRYTLMGAYSEHSRNWVKYRKNKDLEMGHGTVAGRPMTLLYVGQQPYARVDQAAASVGLSVPQVKKLAQDGDMLEFEGVRYIITNRLPEPEYCTD